MPAAVNLVDYAWYLQEVILRGANHADGVIEARSIGDFWCIQIVDTLAPGTVHQIIGGVLVSPSRHAAGCPYGLENCVTANRIMRIEGNTAAADPESLKSVRVEHTEPLPGPVPLKSRKGT